MINIQKHIISEAFEQLSRSEKLEERYSFPEVDDALNHFWNDLGKNPEVDDVIGFLENEYPDWVPTNPEDYGRWYHDVAGEISARLGESKFIESSNSFDVHSVLNANNDAEDITEIVKDPSKIIVYDTWNQMLKDRDRRHTYYIRQNGNKEYEVVKYSRWSADLYTAYLGPGGYSSLEELYARNPGKYDDVDVCLVKEFHDTLPVSESKLTEAPDTMSVKDFAAKMRARKAAQKSENVLDKIKSQLTPDMSVEDQLEVYFDELVPSSGPAKTVAGELIRSIMRILYRDHNDGDLWYTGYGKETCGSSVIYIINHIKDLFRNFEKMSSYQLEEEDYTNALNDIAAKILVYLNENPELFTTPSNEDSRNTREDLDDYFDLPTYEFDVDASYDEDYYDISLDDIDNYIRDVVNSDFRGATVNRWARDGWTIEDLDKEQLEYLEEVWEKWFNDFLSEYEREEEYDEEDEEEDFDKSLKEASKTNKIQPFTVMFFHVEDDDFSTNTGIMYGKNEQEVRDKFARYCPTCKIDRVKKGRLGFDYPMITPTFEYDMGWREEEFKDEDDFEESLNEDTIKQGKKWVNKGDSGKTRGKFDTKKEADAQRKAMFASGWKG